VLACILILSIVGQEFISCPSPPCRAGVPTPAATRLAYHPPVGQVASYVAVFEVSGEQVSLDERRPVKVHAEVELREEVIAQEADGSSWLRVSGKLLKVRDASGTFGVGQHGDWPEVEVRVSPRGEVLEARPGSAEGWPKASSGSPRDRPGPLQRAFADMLREPAAVVLPEGPVAVGEAWRWEANGAWQSNRLLGISARRYQIADILSFGREPISLEERSEALGVTTKVSGEQRQTCHVGLMLPQGLMATAKGEMQIRTRGETALKLAQREERFAVRSDLRVAFNVRLTRLDGQSVDLR
jgi:hypothetical protein